MDDEWEQNPGNLPVTATEARFSPALCFSLAFISISVDVTLAY